MGFAAPAVVLALIASTGLGWAAFVAPGEGPVPFRRDRLPLDADTMRDVSRRVYELAGGVQPKTPADFRELARILAMAVALDPANRPARELIEKLQGGLKEPGGSAASAANSAAALEPVITWLASPEAGEDANGLALCLRDLITPSPDGSEKGRWLGWIPPVTSFQEPEKTDVPLVGVEDAMKTPESEKSLPGPTALAEAGILLPLRSEGKASSVVEIRMTGQVNSGKEELFQFPGDKGRRLATFEPGIRSALTARLGELPAGLHLDLSLPEGKSYDFPLNGDAISGAAVVLLDAAVSGKAPGKVMVLAAVASDGSLVTPANFWTTLRTLPDQPAGRMIVPKSAAESLMGLLTLAGPGFFLSHEVLLAGNVDELCSLAAKEPSPDWADPLQRFAEVAKAAEGKATGAFLAAPATVQRLEQVSVAMPAHASARLLAIQGAGNRPRYLNRALLAREIRTALEPLHYVRGEPENLEPAQLDAMHEQARQAIDALSGVIDNRDRDLPKEAIAAVDNLRTLSRYLKMNDSRRYTEISEKRQEASIAARTGYNTVMAKLTEAAGDSAEYRRPGAR